LFHGCTDTDTQNEALAALNITASPQQVAPDAPLDIWPENWAGLCAFLRMQTQWATAGMGGLMGLRYAEWPQAFEAIQVLESASRRLSRKG
jgi:hypothetical protein